MDKLYIFIAVMFTVLWSVFATRMALNAKTDARALLWFTLIYIVPVGIILLII